MTARRAPLCRQCRGGGGPSREETVFGFVHVHVSEVLPANRFLGYKAVDISFASLLPFFFTCDRGVVGRTTGADRARARSGAPWWSRSARLSAN